MRPVNAWESNIQRLVTETKLIERENKMRLTTGSLVQWSSAAGILVGTITRIDIDLNGANKMVPWIIIKRIDTGTSVMICGTDDNLKGMRVRILELELEEEYELVSSDGTVIDSYTVRY